MGTGKWMRKETRLTAIDTDQFFAAYDDIAVEIVDSSEPNTDVDLVFSNRQLAENICRAMGWEDFDLFETHDFAGVYASGSADHYLAYAFLSFLRFRVFSTAARRGVGNVTFNAKAVAYSEYWYIKLVERWNEQNPVGRPMNAWLN
jgi:hypothetical protein